MVPTEQILHWIEQCEQAAKEHDLAKAHETDFWN
jgi:hypothetical protein